MRVDFMADKCLCQQKEKKKDDYIILDYTIEHSANGT